MKFRVRLPVLKGESLASYLVRLSRVNGYSDPFQTRKIWRREMIRFGYIDDFKLPQSSLAAEMLCELTGLDINVIYEMTVHPIAEALLRPEFVITRKLEKEGISTGLSLSDEQIVRHLRTETRAVYCPLCLRESAYHRIYWQPQAFTVCQEHQCFLMDDCPTCGKAVGVVDVARGHCRHCGQRLSSSQGVMVDPASVESVAQRTIYGWISRDGSEDRLGISADEATQPLNALYHVLWGLRSCLISNTRRLALWGVSWKEDLPQRLDSTAINLRLNSVLISGAFKALQDWPVNFHGFLEVMRMASKGDLGRLQVFGNLYARQIAGDWQTFSYIFVQEAFDEYMGRDPELCASLLKSRRFRDRPRAVDKFPFLPLEKAAEVLHISSSTVSDLVEQGLLQRYNHADSRFVMLKRSEVEALDAQWKDTFSLYELAIRLGIWHENVLDLMTAGLFEGSKGIGRGGVQEWGFKRAEIERFVAELAVRVRHDLEADVDVLDLEATVQRLSVLNVTIVSAVKAVMAEKLAVYVRSDKWRLSDWLFRVDDLDTFAQRFLSEAGWVRRSDVARRMGVKETVVVKWVSAGLLNPIASFPNVSCFDAVDVDRFVAEHVFTEEASEILGIGVLAVQKWARTGRLHPVAGIEEDGAHRYLFRRTELDRLRPENRLTAPQMAKKLGISRATLGEWVKQGRLKPISGPEIDGAKHYLFVKIGV